MKRLVIIVCLLAGLVLLPREAVSAQAVEFDNMEIDIWPEYDRVEALVIYKITIAAQATMPAQITLRMPNGAVQPPTVAMKDVDGQLYNLNFTTAADGDWIKVTFTAPSPNLQFEYYDPGLIKDGDARNFEYHWPGDYAVNNMVFRVQQPSHATNMTILPTQGTMSVESDKLTYYTNVVGNVQAGTNFTYKISYNNPDGLTAPLGSVQPPNPIPSTNQAIPGVSSTTVMIAILGVLLIGGGVAWFFWQRRPQLSVQRRHPPARTAPSSGREIRYGEAIYCHQCGKRAAPGDVYCRICGTRLHT